MKEIYLDYAAASPLDERVFEAMRPFLQGEFYNPSAAYGPARRVRQEIAQARHRLAMKVGAQPSDVIFTAGATESINLAIHGVMRSYGGQVVTTPVEHAAVLGSSESYDRALTSVDQSGYVSADVVKNSITDKTTLVSVGYANSELGTVQPIGEIARVVAQVRQQRRERGIDQPIFLHTDASQAAGFLDLSVARLGVDLLTLNAGKCYGPKQVGLLWASPNVRLAPLVNGGGQERGLRAGTENVAGVVGFAVALELAKKRRKTNVRELSARRDLLQQRLTKSLPDLVVNGHQKHRLASHLHVSLLGLDGERAVFALDAQGIYVATGSACAANKGTRSHVLTAVGMPYELADGSLRFTLGRGISDDDINYVAPIIAETLRRERRLS